MRDLNKRFVFKFFVVSRPKPYDQLNHHTRDCIAGYES